MSPLGQEPVPAAGAGGVRLAGAGKTGTVFGAAERAQCVPRVTHPGRGAAARRAAERCAGGAGCPGKGGDMDLISLEWRQKGPKKEGGWEVLFPGVEGFEGALHHTWLSARGQG